MLTQFLSVSLHRHIANTYKFDMFSKGFVEVLAAQQTNESADWYQGTADAVRQNLSYIEREDPDEVLILSGDQLYRMDFRQLIETHRATRADVTIAGIPVTEKDTAGFGLLSMDDAEPRHRVRGEAEDGRGAGAVLHLGRVDRAPRHRVPGPPLPGQHGHLPVQDARCCYDLLTAKPLATDFGKEVFPRNYQTQHVAAHLFDGYWEDLGTIRSYHEASLALAGAEPAVRLLHARGGDLHPHAEPAGQPHQRGGAAPQRGRRRVRDRRRHRRSSGA